MKARDIFGLVLRCAALWIIVWGAWQIAAAVVMLPATVESLLTSNPNQVRYSTFTYLIYGAPAVFCGILVLGFANAIVRFTYRE